MASFNNPIDTRMWGDKRFKALSRPQPNAQFLWVYLLTGPHNRGLPGLYNAGPAEMAEVLEWQPGDVAALMKELSAGDRPMAVADWPARVIFVPKIFSYRPPQAESNVKAWVRPFEGIPESRLRAAWLEALAAHGENRTPGFRAGLEEHFGAIAAGLGVNLTPRAELWVGQGAAQGAGQGGAQGAEQDRDKDRGIPTPNDTAEAVRAVESLGAAMRLNDPKARVPAAGTMTYRRWVEEMDRLHRMDGRGWEQILAVIEWCQGDDFWKGNVLSAAKLREKFGTLVLQMGRKNGGRAAKNAAEFRRAMGKE